MLCQIYTLNFNSVLYSTISKKDSSQNYWVLYQSLRLCNMHIRSMGTNLSKTALTLKCSFCIILLSNRGNLAVSKLLISSTAFFNLCQKNKGTDTQPLKLNNSLSLILPLGTWNKCMYVLVFGNVVNMVFR